MEVALTPTARDAVVRGEHFSLSHTRKHYLYISIYLFINLHKNCILKRKKMFVYTSDRRNHCNRCGY